MCIRQQDPNIYSDTEARCPVQPGEHLAPSIVLPFPVTLLLLLHDDGLQKLQHKTSKASASPRTAAAITRVCLTAGGLGMVPPQLKPHPSAAAARYLKKKNSAKGTCFLVFYKWQSYKFPSTVSPTAGKTGL